MSEFISLVVNGILIGGVYALVGLAIVVIYKSSSVFNFAVGDFVMWGGFVMWTFLVAFDLPIWASILFAVVVMAIIGLLTNRLLISPMAGQPLLAVVLLTLGLSYLLKGVHSAAWGPTWKAFPPLLPSGKLTLGSISFSADYMWCFIIAMVAFGIFSYLFQRTRMGLAMRATAEDHQLARSTGISVKTIFSATWILAALLCLVAGVLLGSVNNLGPQLADIGLKGFPVVLFGGLESVVGCIVGGIVVGVLENLGAAYLNPLVGGGIEEVVPFVVMLLVLMFKPYGLFGLKRIERL